MASTYDLNLIQGNTFSGRLIATNSDGTYVNLSGYTSSGVAKYRYGASTGNFSISPTIDTSYISGIINIFISGSTLLNIPVGIYYYDVNIYGGGGYVNRILNGKANVSPIVTY